MTADHVDGWDGSLVIRAFERLAADACAPDASPERVLEAAAMGVALAELGLVERALDRDRVASRARKVLLGAGALRSAVGDASAPDASAPDASVADEEDARDALELAIDQARRGLALLSGGSISALDGAPTHEPTPRDLSRLLRGELDGHASADVALRLHRSGARDPRAVGDSRHDRYAAFLPERPLDTRVRLAADSAPGVRDPSLGRSLGTLILRSGGSLEAHAFEGGVIAIYAESSMTVALTSIDVPLVGRVIETSGYLELCVEGDPESVTLVLADGDRSLTWSLNLH